MNAHREAQRRFRLASFVRAENLRPVVTRPQFHLCLSVCAAVAAGALLGAAENRTVYQDSARASDADRIATQMLNDAASGRWRQQNYSRPHNPFDRMIEDYENAKRAKAADQARYAAEAARQRAEIAAEERLASQERARQQQADENFRRIDVLQQAANRFDARAHLQLGMLIESGRYSTQDIKFPAGTTPQSWTLARYSSALILGLDVGVVAFGCAEKKTVPAFPQLWERVQSLGTTSEREAYLSGLAEQGHLGANLWLGGWHAGYDVSLGSPPALRTRGENRRQTALRYLERAHRTGYSHATVWFAEVLVSGETKPGERARGLALMDGLLKPGPDRELAAVPTHARELLRDARVEADAVRARALFAEFEKVQYVHAYVAWAAMHLEGTDGEYHPGQAARVLRKMPEAEVFAVHHIRGRMAAGIDAYFGVDAPVDARAAITRFTEATKVRVTGTDAGTSVRARRTDAQLWRAFVLAEEKLSAPDLPDPFGYLAKAVSADHALAMLLSACAELGRPAMSAQIARNTWNTLALITPFARPLPPEETLLVLRCALRAHERGGLPELGPFVAEIRALAPKSAPIQGAALLARLYFSGVHPRDVAERAGTSHVFSALVRAAWREPKRWEQVAALVEVLQIDPLTRDQWNAGWLAPFLEKHPAASAEQKRWAAQLAAPAPDAQGELSLRSSASLSLVSPGPPEIQALDASLRIRGASTNEQARSAFVRLLGLARAGHWHAQALIEDFPERYRASYLRRRDLEGYRRDALEAAEKVADWRGTGHAFMLPNEDQQMRAIGHALALGSTRVSRAALQQAADRKVKPARIALLRLDALAADPRTPRERDDDEIAGDLWRRHCEQKGLSPDIRSTLYQLRWVGSEIARQSGAEAAFAFWGRQSARYPELAWEIAVDYAEGSTAGRPDFAAALGAFRKASALGRQPPRFAELIAWADTAARHGTPADFAAIDHWSQQPRYGLARWRFPDEKGFSTTRNPPVKTAERLAAAALTRGAVIQAVQSKQEIERALRLNLLAVGLGSELAAERLRQAPFASRPGVPVTLAKVMLEASTLNAPVAVEQLRPVAARDPEAARLLAPWIDARTGQPTPRLQRILARRRELANTATDLHVDPVAYHRGDSNLDHGWLTWEQAMLVRAAKQGDAEARAILVQHGLMLPTLIDVTPAEWVNRAQGALRGDDAAALWQLAAEAPALWRSARYFWIPGDRPWTTAARSIGEIAVRLATAAVPSGRTRDELMPLLEIGLEGGHGASFPLLHRLRLAAVPVASDTDRQRASDTIVFELARTILDQDLGNAAFLEVVARPLLRDPTRWDELFVQRLLYAESSGEPTSVLLFARENAIREPQATDATLMKGDPIRSSFFPFDGRYRLGQFGDRLLSRALENDPLAARALATLGFARGDWDEILRP